MLTCDNCGTTMLRIEPRDIKTYDFDTDGKVFHICPKCLCCDTLGTQDARELIREIINYNSIVSRRQLRSCIQQLSFRYGNFENNEERKQCIAKLFYKAKRLDDNSKIELIANTFNIPRLKVETMLIVVLRMHSYGSTREEIKQERKWWVVPSQN